MLYIIESQVRKEKSLFGKVNSAVLYGIESRIISVEADVSDGLPQFSMVGYLSSEVREAQERVRTAIKNSGYKLLPKKVTVNLTPADLRKAGSWFDLPIAVAVMAAYGYVPAALLEGVFLAGELGLDGSLHEIRGVLGMVREAKRAGVHTCIVPAKNAGEASVIGGTAVFGASDLREVILHLTSPKKLPQIRTNIEEILNGERTGDIPDFADIRGQHFAKRAAEIAAAGMHNLLLGGPPGAGKTMIAGRIAGILPPMGEDEALEVSQIYSVAGLLPKAGIVTQRPFRSPHHTASAAALAGGGYIPRPGEISLAHRGVLYLDEVAEFHQETLEILRQPREEGVVRISRNSGQYTFPADFMLVASRNPCKCGYYPDRSKCRCSEREVLRYLHRISRPLLDRIDLHVQVGPMRYEELTRSEKEESSQTIRARVLRAHAVQEMRYRGSRFRFNSDLTAAALGDYCPLSADIREKMERIYEQKNLTARAYHRMVKVARTIADLEGAEQITMKHMSEALLYRAEEALM